MKEKGKDLSSNSIAFILFSYNTLTSLKGDEWKGYAGNTKRLDIPVRSSYLILKSSLARNYENIEFSMVLYGPPKPPLHIHLDKKFYENKTFETERELMRYFIESVFSENTKGYGWWKENKGLIEVVNYYHFSGYKPVLLREKESLVFPEDRSPKVYLMGTDRDIPSCLLKGIVDLDMASIGEKNYLTSHVALFTLFFDYSMKKHGGYQVLIHC